MNWKLPKIRGNKMYSVGIIGGADGPTAVFVSHDLNWAWIAGAALVVLGVIWWTAAHRKK